MPKADQIADVLAGRRPTGSRATVQGWIRTRRNSKAGLSFLHLHDGSCFDALQVVAPAALANYEDEVLRLTAGCAVTVTGTLAPSQGQGQAVELLADSIIVVGWVDDPETYPITPKRHTFEYLREVGAPAGADQHDRRGGAGPAHAGHGHPPLLRRAWLLLGPHADRDGRRRRGRRRAVPRVHARPGQPAADTRRGGRLRAGLLRAPGLPHGVRAAERRELLPAPSRRCTRSGPRSGRRTPTPAGTSSEFWMVEPEIAFADLSDNADLAEDLLKLSFRALLDERPDDMAFFAERIDKEAISRLEGLVTSSFARMEYTEAVEVLQRSGRSFEFPVAWGLALQAEHERYLCEEYAKRPVVVVNYPKEIKAFYMRLNDDERTVAAMDVLAPGIGEIVGGSQREERLDVLDARMTELGFDPAAYWWYRDLRRYGSVPHAGFGLGFDRSVAYATGMANIRDVIPFPARRAAPTSRSPYGLDREIVVRADRATRMAQSAGGLRSRRLEHGGPGARHAPAAAAAVAGDAQRPAAAVAPAGAREKCPARRHRRELPCPALVNIEQGCRPGRTAS